MKSEPLRVIVGLIKVMIDLSNSCLHFQGWVFVKRSHFQEGMCARFRFFSSGTRLPYGRRTIYLEYSSFRLETTRRNLTLFPDYLNDIIWDEIYEDGLYTLCQDTWSRDITGDCWGKNHDKGKVIVSSMSWMILAIDDEGKVPLVLALDCGWL